MIMRNRMPIAPLRRPSRNLVGGRGLSVVEQPYFELGFDGQPLAHLAGPMDADVTKAMHATAGTVNRSWRAAGTWRLLSGRILDFYVAQQDGSNPDDVRIASIYLRYSDDECQTWSVFQQIYVRETSGTPDYVSNSKWINGPLGFAQHSSGRCHLIVCKSDGAKNSQIMTVWHMTSADGVTGWNSTSPTNISAAVVKANNTTPAGQPACYGGTNGAWEWVMVTSGLCKKVAPNIGRIIFFGDHRYDTNEAGSYTSWSHCFYTDNGDSATPTWVLGGGYDETVAANNESNETACVELNNGSILIQNRVQTGANAYFRGQQTLTDITTTWPQMDFASDGVSDLEANPVHGTLWKNADGSKVYSAYAVDESVRANIKVYESIDNGVTWSVGRSIFYGLCGYCYGLTLANGNHRVLFEKTHNYGAESFGAQYLTQARFNDVWLENEALYPAVFKWRFTESLASVMATVGSQLLDCGKDGTRIFDQRGLGAANASFYFSGGEYGLLFAGSGAGVQLQESQADGVGGALQPGLGSATYEFEITQAAGVSQRVVLDDCNITSAGVSIFFTTTGRPRARVGDGAQSVVTTAGSGALDNNDYDGLRHRYAVVVDRTAHTLQVFEIIGDTAVSRSSASSIAAVTGKIVGGQAVRLGRRSTTDSEHLIAGTILHQFQVTRAALTGGWMPQAGPVGVTINDLFPVPTFPTIANYPATPAIVHLGATFDQGAYARSDFYGGFDRIHRSALLGRGAAAYRDVAQGKLFKFVSVSRGMYWDYDSDVGPHWRHMYFSGTSGGNYVSCNNVTGAAAAYAALDIIQELGVFSIFGTCKILTNATVVIFDTCNNTSGNNGVTLAAASGVGNNVFWRVGGAAQFNENIAMNFPFGTWFNWMVTANGSGKYQFYKSTISGFAVGATTGPVASSANVQVPGAGARSSGQPATGFARSDGNAAAADVREKNGIMVFPAALGATEFAALCQLSVLY